MKKQYTDHDEFKEKYANLEDEYENKYNHIERTNIESKQCCAFDIHTNKRCNRVIYQDKYCIIHINSCKSMNNTYFNGYWMNQHNYETEFTKKWRRYVINIVNESNINIDQAVKDRKLFDELFEILYTNFDEIEILYIYYESVYNANYRLKKQFYCYQGNCTDISHYFEQKIREISGNVIYYKFKLKTRSNINDQKNILSTLIKIHQKLLQTKRNLSLENYILEISNLSKTNKDWEKELYNDLYKILLVLLNVYTEENPQYMKFINL